MTLCFSKYFSAKKKMNKINESNHNSQINDINHLTNSSKKTTAHTRCRVYKNHKKFEIIKKKPLLLKSNSNFFLLEKKKNKEKYKEDKEETKKEDSSFRVYKNIEVSRMTLELNDIILHKKKKTYYLKDLEKSLIKFKACQQFQEERLEIMSKQDINGLEKRILFLQKNITKYNSVTIEYFREINNYLHFLKEKTNSLYNFSEQENNIRFNLFFEIEKLVNDNVSKQKELEQLIEIRHFLIKVKNTLQNLPNYFSTILKEVSRKYELGKLILGLKLQPQNQNVIKFLDSIPEIKNGEIPTSIISKSSLKSSINKSILKKKTKKMTQLYSFKPKSNNNLSKYMIDTEKKIFETPEEFLIIFDNIESKNLRLMKEHDYIKRNIDILRKEYNDICKSNTIMERYNDINLKEEKIKKLKEEKIVLERKLNLIKNSKNEKDDLSNKKSEITSGFFMDLNIFKKITYYRMLQNYKYPYLLFLEKLIDIINNFLESIKHIK